LEYETAIAEKPAVPYVVNIDDPVSFRLACHIIRAITGADGHADHVWKIKIPVHEIAQHPGCVNPAHTSAF
jgi:hypothetical protein